MFCSIQILYQPHCCDLLIKYLNTQSHRLCFFLFLDTNQQSYNLSALLGNEAYSDSPNWELTRVHAVVNEKGLHVDFRPPRLAQFVVVRREMTNDLMTICEVEVFEGGKQTN